jgi:hypothetical protein
MRDSGFGPLTRNWGLMNAEVLVEMHGALAHNAALWFAILSPLSVFVFSALGIWLAG